MTMDFGDDHPFHFGVEPGFHTQVSELAPSHAALLVGHGCTQPAWTDPPEANVISDIVVDWQLWEASP